ncbi:MAG: TonB-dependent siderophore receptor [Steroidobacteraceae bacterium]
MKSRQPSIALAVKTALLAAQGLMVVHADEAQQASPTEGDLETVTVYGQAETYRPVDQTTATGLRMKLIDTPQSISVISEEMLKAAGASSAYDALDLIPGAHQNGSGYGIEKISIRGQGILEPRTNGMASEQYDFVDAFLLERLEIVRGPATVLYGVTGAFGGEVNQILKTPQDDFRAEFGLVSSSFSSLRYEADVTGSIPGTDDRLKARLVGSYSDYGIPQETVNARTNIDKNFLGSATFDFTPNTVGGVYLFRSQRDNDPTDGCPLGVDASNRLFVPSTPLEHWYCGDAKQNNLHLKTDWAYASLSHHFSNDWQMTGKVASSSTESVIDYLYAFGPAGAYGLNDDEVYLYSYDWDIDNDYVTTDLSLGGSFDLAGRTHQFFAALEYHKRDQTYQNFFSNFLGFLRLGDGGRGVLADGSPIPFAPDRDLVGVRTSNNEELRASIQAQVNLSDRLNILAGILVQDTDVTEENARVNLPVVTSRITRTDTVTRLGATYDVADEGEWLFDAKAYLSFSEGFRPNVGQFDIDGNPLTDPQDMTSYEVGLKSEWNDGHVSASLALYEAELTNVPQTNFVIGQTGGTFATTLEGKRKFNGVELELVGEILPGWNAALSYAYTHSEIFSQLISEQLAVNSVPKHQASLNTSYEFLNGPLGGLIVGTAIVSKIDSPLIGNVNAFFEGDYDPNDQLLQSDTRVDFRASYKGFTGPLEGLEIFANVYNANDVTYYYSLTGGHPGFANNVGQPRTYSFGVRYSFDR